MCTYNQDHNINIVNKMAMTDQSLQWLRYGLRNYGIGILFPAGMDTPLFSTASGMVQGLTQLPLKWGPKALSPWIKLLHHEDEHSSISSAEVQPIQSYTTTHQISSWSSAYPSIFWLVGSFPYGIIASHSFHCCITVSCCVSGDLL